ncbi:hypothetical protein [Tumebacillus flagellatus]|uniref:Uncharacterized protein n=1 Tax=Tumebacillus flagellatus TaxID=1157490 RepID=A0A074MGR3_9BACL|nr:hypothetical protein [Tumebacillus flagellatus]KEO84917.1 hypothetical protein EL26_02595 [Tumebacillus flagellatus]
MKTTIVASIALSLLTCAVTPSAFGDEVNKSGFSAQHKMTANELAQHQKELQTANLQRVQDQGYKFDFSNKDPKPSLTSPNWSYSALWPGHYIDTNTTYTTTTNGEQVVVKLVQYPDLATYGSYVAKASYQLVGSSYIQPYQVTGNYDSTNFTFSFYNVPIGTWRLRIFNDTSGSGAVNMAGNGYVYYY